MGDRREVQIGRDATGNAIISGDGNVVIVQTIHRLLKETPAEPSLVDRAIEPASNVRALGPNPYRGLDAFGEADANRFFGRAAAVDKLWGRLCALHEVKPSRTPATRLLPVLGPSGSGKSSLVRAGLLPELARRPLPGRTTLRVAVLTPGVHPLEALAVVLARIASSDDTPVAKVREFASELRGRQEERNGKPMRFVDGLRRIGDVLPDADRRPLIVLVDQFEEVYSLCKDATERDDFIANLLDAAADAGSRVTVVLTLRTDFIGETQRHPELNRLVASQGEIVSVMRPDELRLAIVEPARLAGHSFDAATAELLVSQSEGREGALPLLQFALTRIWEGLTDGIEPAVTLERVGGVGGALAKEAQRLYDSLGEAEQLIARRAFVSLVQLGEGTLDTRRRATLGGIVAHGEDPERVNAVLAAFARPGVRVVTLSAAGDGEDTAELTHEALIKHWATLQDWVDGRREDIQFHRRLNDAAERWRHAGRPPGLLWRSPDLDRLREFRARNARDMTAIEVEFFDRSEAAVRRGRHVLVAATSIFLLLFAVAVAAAFVAVVKAKVAAKKTQEAKDNEQTAQRNARESELRLAENMIFQGEALRQSNRWKDALSITDDARRRLVTLGEPMLRADLATWSQQRGSALPLLTLGDHGSEFGRQSIAVSRDGSTIATVGGDKLIFWNLRAGVPADVAPVRGMGPDGVPLKGTACAVVLSADGRTAITTTTEGDLDVHRFGDTTKRATPLKGARQRLYSIAVSPGGRWAIGGPQVVADENSGPLCRWDLTAPENDPVFFDTRDGHRDRVTSVAFVDDDRAVTTSWDGTLKLWKVAEGSVYRTFYNREKVECVAVSPDGSRILSGDFGPTVKLWDPKSESVEPLRVFRGHRGYVREVSFSPSGRSAASCSDDGTVRIWDLNSGKELRQFTGHERWTNSVALVDDRTVLSGGGDQVLRLWTLVPGGELRDHPRHSNHVYGLAFSPDGRMVISGGDDGMIRLSDVSTGKPLAVFTGHTAAVRSLALSEDGTLLSGGQDGALKVWDLTQGVLARVLPGERSGVNCVALSRDGRKALSGTQKGELTLWEFQDGKVEALPFIGYSNSAPRGDGPGPLSGVAAVAFSRDGKLAASGDHRFSDHQIQIWDTSTRRLKVPPIKGHGDAVTSISFSPGGRELLTSSWHFDGTGGIKLWRVADGTEIRGFRGHTNRVYHALFAPGEGSIFSASGDFTLRVWDPNTGAGLRVFEEHQDRILSLACSDDGGVVATASRDGIVKCWSFGRVARSREFVARLATAQAALRKRADDAESLAVLGEWYAFRGMYDWSVDFLERARTGGATMDRLTLARAYWCMADSLPPSDQAGRSTCLKAAARELRAAAAIAPRPNDVMYITILLRAIETSDALP